MRLLRDARQFLCGCFLLTALTVAGTSGCQMGAEMGPAPDPFLPRGLFMITPPKPAGNYAMSDDAAALKAARSEQTIVAK
jgi:hypothetical protein